MKAVISAKLLATKEAQARVEPFEIRDTRLKGLLLRVQPSGVRTYYAQLARGKRERIGNVSEFTPDEARDRCELMLGNFVHGRPVRADMPGAEGPKETTLQRYIDDVYEAYQLGQFKTGAGTIQRLKTLFKDWLDLPLRSITAALVDTWKSGRSKVVKPRTVLRDMQILSGLLQHAIDVGKLLTVNVVHDVSKPIFDRRQLPRFLDDDEEKRLRATIAERDAERMLGRARGNAHRAARGKPLKPELPYFADQMTPVILLGMKTGLRRGEFHQLLWTDITIRDGKGMLTVEGQRDGQGSKSSQSRHIPLHAEAIDVLRKWREQCPDSDEVFPHIKHAKTAWGGIIKRAKIRRFRFRNLRNHFGSMLAQKGVPLNTIRELLGHASIETTLIYAGLSPKETRAAVDLL